MPGGLRKAKEYDWKDSNMALVGSDTDRKVKKESAESEPAWQGSGKRPGVEVWRINKFKVEKVPRDEYGQFYSGDSYIILNTYKDKETDALLYDVHFWIGKYSTQDEYGTAAYKTVELDTFHDDKPIQHREVMGHESKLFLGYFEHMQILKGGYDTGFKRVRPEEYQPRLLRFQGTTMRNIQMTEIPMKRGNLNEEDTFVIDLGHTLYQYNGKDADKDERFKAFQYMQKIRSDRFGKPKTETLDGYDVENGHPVLDHFKEGKSQQKAPTAKNQVGMFQVSDRGGKLKMDEVITGSLDRNKLTEDDVFIIDTGTEVFLYIGKDASVDERQNAMTYATNYLHDKENPFAHVTVVSSGQKCAAFEKIWV